MTTYNGVVTQDTLEQFNTYHSEYLTEVAGEENRADFTRLKLFNIKPYGRIFDKAIFKNASIEYCIFTSFSFKDCDFDGASISDCIFCGCNFEGSTFKNAFLKANRFTAGCNMNNCYFSRSVFRFNAFTDISLDGIRAYNCEIDKENCICNASAISADVRDTNINLVSFTNLSYNEDKDSTSEIKVVMKAMKWFHIKRKWNEFWNYILHGQL